MRRTRVQAGTGRRSPEGTAPSGIRTRLGLVQLRLRGTIATELDVLNAAVRRVPETPSCHVTAGGFDDLPGTRTLGIRH